MATEEQCIEHHVIVEKGSSIKRGDTGPAVIELQKHLMNARYSVKPDGDFGKNTYTAVVAFQKANGLVTDGIVGEKTLTLLCGANKKHTFLSQADIEKGAAALGVPVATLMAVNTVESSGKGFLSPGRPVILYERHIMYRELRDYGIDPVKAMRDNPGLVNTKRGGYLGGMKEWLRLEKAQVISHDAALESASWGAYQIMGFHWELLGFGSVQEYIDYVSVSEANQLDCFVRFIKSQKNLWVALRAKNWAAFARLYNGPAYKENQYDVKLADAYEDAVLVLAA